MSFFKPHSSIHWAESISMDHTNGSQYSTVEVFQSWVRFDESLYLIEFEVFSFNTSGCLKVNVSDTPEI